MPRRDLFVDLAVLERHGSCTATAVTHRNQLYASLHPIRVYSVFNPWLSFP
jgi:hypothetical protein